MIIPSKNNIFGKNIRMDSRKIIQALAYFASRQEDKTLDNRKAYKLLWLADRYHLRHNGRMISGDTYFAMPHGTVPSDAKNLLENQQTNLYTDKTYFKKYILTQGNSFKAIDNPDMNVFSISDREALDIVFSLFNDLNADQLSEISHQFPEWIAYKECLEDTSKRNSFRIDVKYFFEDNDAQDRGLFASKPEVLELAKAYYFQTNNRG